MPGPTSRPLHLWEGPPPGSPPGRRPACSSPLPLLATPSQRLLQALLHPYLQRRPELAGLARLYPGRRGRAAAGAFSRASEQAGAGRGSGPVGWAAPKAAAVAAVTCFWAEGCPHQGPARGRWQTAGVGGRAGVPQQLRPGNGAPGALQAAWRRCFGGQAGQHGAAAGVGEAGPGGLARPH
jgi:hypothetical protein